MSGTSGTPIIPLTYPHARAADSSFTAEPPAGHTCLRQHTHAGIPARVDTPSSIEALYQCSSNLSLVPCWSVRRVVYLFISSQFFSCAGLVVGLLGFISFAVPSVLLSVLFLFSFVPAKAPCSSRLGVATWRMDQAHHIREISRIYNTNLVAITTVITSQRLPLHRMYNLGTAGM